MRSSSSVRWLDICFLGYPCGAAAAASIVLLGILMQLLLHCFLGHTCAVLLQVFPWTFLCSCCFDCFCRHSCAAAVSIVFLGTFLWSCCFNCFLRHSCAAAASIVFLGTFLCSCCFNCFSWDILVQLLLQGSILCDHNLRKYS